MVIEECEMEIEQYKQNLEICFTEYENLQSLHLDVMKTEPMPDIARMTEERDSAFDRLKQIIDSFVGNAASHGGSDNRTVLAEYETRLTSIMNVSEELSKAILEYRENLKTSLAQMKQSKAAMQGYKAVNMN
jgi:chromosome segregation ATPase